MKSEAIDTADENRTSPVEEVDTASLPPAQHLTHCPIPQHESHGTAWFEGSWSK